jgi:hypothetical protein
MSGRQDVRASRDDRGTPFTDDVAILPVADALPRISTEYREEKASNHAASKDTYALYGDKAAGNAGGGQRGMEEGDGLRLSADEDHDRISVRAIPRRYQLLAFSMIIFFNTSSSFSESTLSPLKGVFRQELGVTSRSDPYTAPMRAVRGNRAS